MSVADRSSIDETDESWESADDLYQSEPHLITDDAGYDVNGDASGAEEGENDLEESTTPRQRPSIAGANFQKWNARNSFTAESPYYSAFVDAEVESLSLLTDTMRDITSRTKTFAKAGNLMSEAMRRLAQSCRLRQDAAESSSEDLKTVPVQQNDLYNRRRKAVGTEMASLLEHLGGILDELATAQSAVSQAIEMTLGLSLEAFAASELRTVSLLKSEADEITDTAEQMFSKYMTGKSFVESFHEGGKNTGPQTLVNKSFTQLKNWRSQIEIRRGKSEPSASDATLERAVEASGLVSNLEQVCLLQATAELKRFQLMKHLISVKHRRNFELGENCMSTVYEFSNFYRNCSSVLAKVMPAMQKIQEKQNSLRTEHASYIVPTWSEREVALIEAVDRIHKKAIVAAQNVDAISSGDVKLIDQQVINSDEIEEQVQIWNLPHVLALSARYQRDSLPGVVMEGWLYKKSNAMISLQPWIRRWFVMDHDSIFYYRPVDGDGKRGSRERHGGAERVKVCDIVLCTVRELKPEGPSSRFCFQIVTPSEKPLTLQARGPLEYRLWVDGIRENVENGLVHGDPHSRELNKHIGRQAPVIPGVTDKHKDGFSQLAPTEFRSIADERFDETPPLIHKAPVKKKNPLAERVMALNPICADCGVASPEWASLNIGVLICIECSGVHRSLGVNVSKVRSLMLDSFTRYEGNLLCLLGNDIVNAIWEEDLATQKGWKKPNPEADRQTRENWIRSKYLWKGFLSFHECENMNDNDRQYYYSKMLYEASKRGDVKSAASALAHGGDIQWCNDAEGGKTPLHIAALLKKDQLTWPAIEMCEFLLQNGAKIDTLDSAAHGVLDCALLHGASLEMVEYLTGKSA